MLAGYLNYCMNLSHSFFVLNHNQSYQLFMLVILPKSQKYTVDKQEQTNVWFSNTKLYFCFHRYWSVKSVAAAICGWTPTAEE